MKKIQFFIFLLVFPTQTFAQNYIPSSIKHKMKKLFGKTPDIIIAVNTKNMVQSPLYGSIQLKLTPLVKKAQNFSKCIKNIYPSDVDYILLTGNQKRLSKKENALLIIQGSFNAQKIAACFAKEENMTPKPSKRFIIYQNKKHYIFSPGAGKFIFMTKNMLKKIKPGRGIGNGDISFISNYTWTIVFTWKEPSKSSVFKKLNGILSFTSDLSTNLNITYQKRSKAVQVFKQINGVVTNPNFASSIFSNTIVTRTGKTIKINSTLNSSAVQMIVNFIPKPKSRMHQNNKTPLKSIKRKSY